MVDQFVQVSPDSSGKKIATDEVDVGGQTVQRQVVRLSGDSPTEIADVRGATPDASDMGMVVRPIGGGDVTALTASTGAASDAAAVAGSTGTIQAKLRIATSLLNELGLAIVALQGLIGTTAAAASTAGGEGSNSAKLRLMTSQLDSTVTGISLMITRLTEVRDAVDGLEGLATSLNAFVDGLEGFTDGLEGGIGAAADAAATAGSAGSMNAKQRLMTTLLDAINTKVLTDAQLRAAPVPVSGTITASGGATEATLAAVAASVDGLEGLATTLNTLVDGLEGFVDGIEAALATLNAKDFSTQATLATLSATATTISGNVDGIEAALTTIQGYIDSLETAFGTSADASSVTGSLHAKTRATAESLAVIDDWDETDRAKVNVVAGQVGITAGAGAVAANTPRVTHASDDPVTTALQVIDDWDETDRAKVNTIAGQAGVAAGTGVDGVTVQRVSLATNVPLPAGTNAIGKLAANSSVDIGDVDVTSVIPGVAATSLGKAEDAVAASGDTGVMALAVRNDAGTPLAADGDYIPLGTDGFGNLRATLYDDQGIALTAVDGVLSLTVNGNVGVSSLPSSSNSTTFTAAGNGISSGLTGGLKHHSLQVTATGAVTSWDVRLEGSNDNITWTQIVQHTNVSGSGVTVAAPAPPFLVLAVRTRCAAIVLGAGTNIVCGRTSMN